MDTVDPRILAVILTAIGWISRELWRRRQAKRQAASDAGKILSDKKKLLGEMISKTKDANSKQILTAQLEEVNAALLGLHGERLRHTLEEAGLPSKAELIADGRSQLQPQQVDHLKKVTEDVEILAPFVISVRDLFVLGNAYYYMQQYQDARKTYDQILTSKPDCPEALYNRGITYAELERYDEALADYNRALELRPDYPEALNMRGITYARLEKYDEALADLNRALDLKPNFAPTLYNLACLFSLLGKIGEALAYLEKAISKDKKNCEMAKTDKDFDNIRDAPRFRKLVESD